MGRKTQITKEQLLQAGLDIVIRDGYQSVSIVNVAKEIGCSTHPVIQSFGSMDVFRTELFRYAFQYLDDMIVKDSNPVVTFEHVGETYIKVAIEKPNLLIFLRTDERLMKELGGIGAIFDDEKNGILGEAIAREMHVSKEDGLSFIQFAYLYTEGIVSMILAGILQFDTLEDAHRLMHKAGDLHMAYFKVRDNEI